MANLYITIGNYPAARELSGLALRTSLRHGLKAYAGMAHHALFIIAAEASDTKEANEAAARAFDLYGPTHPRIRALAHDVAFFWASHGRFARALPVFEATLQHFPHPDDHAVVAANAARAAAAVGDRSKYELRWNSAQAAIMRCTNELRVADALLTLAHAAGNMQDFEHASEAASRAREIADQRGFAHIKLRAEAELEAIRAEAVTAANSPTSESLAARETAERLATNLVSTLTRVSGYAYEAESSCRT